ncbi:hypothetical protein [Parapedobacter indicus]|uniref:Uncharacterized protein n=1 Tax=Parapedobacter indicus TaxID=1477437 RepID=A0A1I3VD54_9SPHI|nr:hypothetical protein [Parapedobacter indicus]PPK98916.1 hypothetical protein CLV26_11626 [Parapedobacter indicus]SFJ92949.1 hypothetical protein SAMN05444682_11658 [Parapedobacter indicus]
MALNENDLIHVIDELRLKGYTETFVIKGNLVYSTNLNRGFREEEIIIDGAYRFDVTEDAFDTQYLFAISLPQHRIRGLIIDLLGMYFYMEEQSVTKILRDADIVNYVFDDQDPFVKYGLKKITPSDFDADSKRYVLRIGFPDYPACPVGTDFTMLGFDEQTQEYVWLATSILKDSRLRKVAFTKYGTENIWI